MADTRELIAKNIAAMLRDGDVVNLGIGIPSLVSDYIPDDVEIILHGENGSVGLGPAPQAGSEDKDLVNASGAPTTLVTGAVCFDSATSFGLIRGGHLDATVLGGLEVDERGNLANWIIPGKFSVGMGGAMDLVAGAKKVIVAMEHTAKDGSPKILKKCTLPLTGEGVVTTIVTELGIIDVTPRGLRLKALAPGATVEKIRSKTEAELLIPDVIETMI